MRVTNRMCKNDVMKLLFKCLFGAVNRLWAVMANILNISNNNSWRRFLYYNFRSLLWFSAITVS
jgi:hypothetical protein